MNQEVVPNCTGGSCVIQAVCLRLKRNPASLKNVLDKAVKVVLLSLDLLSTRLF